MPFVKGKSGNPKGRPPGTLELLPLIAKRFEEINPETGKSYKEEYAISYVDKHVKEARTDALDRYDGKPMQRTDLTTGGEKITGLTMELIHATKDTSTGSV